MDLNAQYGIVVSDWAAVPLHEGLKPLAPGTRRDVAILGAGPSALIAAEVLAMIGHRVTIYERMPSPARKFLLAGRGGLNLTHSEPLDVFLSRYGQGADAIRKMVTAFPPAALIGWAEGLGQETFTGSSGRVFPKPMKASPLLRAWLKRLEGLGVQLMTRHTFIGFAPEGGILMENPLGQRITLKPDATLLALGGASWPKLGSDGRWQTPLIEAGVAVAPLSAANAAVLVAWSEIFIKKFEGHPLKRIAVSVGGSRVRGEAVITRIGLEGGAVYALSRAIRQQLTSGTCEIAIDLTPDISEAELATRLGAGKQKDTLSNLVRKAAGLSPAAVGLLREQDQTLSRDPGDLARRIKSLRLAIIGIAGLERAISSAGGVKLDELDGHNMLKSRPGVFVAGEMLDWEAPTGGYLLQACFASGVLAGRGIAHWLKP